MLAHRNQGHHTVLGTSPEACPRTRTKAKMKSFWGSEGEKVEPRVRAGPGAVRKEKSWRQELQLPPHSGPPGLLQDIAKVKSTVTSRELGGGRGEEHGTLWEGKAELRGTW